MTSQLSDKLTMPVRPRRSAGFTLLELLTALVMVGVLASLAAPSLAGQTAQFKTRAALNALAGDLAHARMSAVRAGHSAEVRFTWNDDRSCITSYDIVELTTPERMIKKVPAAAEARGVCLKMNNAGNRLIFNSRGLPRTVAARSFYAQAGVARDSMRMAQAGRLLRFP